jgi:hypothetical protein
MHHEPGDTTDPIEASKASIKFDAGPGPAPPVAR